MQFGFLFLLLGFYAGPSWSLPFLISNQEGKIEAVEIPDSILLQQIEPKILRQLNLRLKDVEGEVLKSAWVVVGVSTDARFGLPFGRVTGALGMEFHLRRLR